MTAHKGHGPMGARRHIPAGYSPFGNLYAGGDIAESLAERDVAFEVTRWRDRLGNVIVRKVNQSPVRSSIPKWEDTRPPVMGVSHRAYANSFAPDTMGSKSGPVVPPGMQFDVPPGPTVGAPHHGGGGGGHHHGGGHGHHGGGRRLAPDSWNLWGDYGYPVYEVAPCPEGYVELPDGTCVHAASLLDFHTGEGLVVENVEVGRSRARRAPSPSSRPAGRRGPPFVPGYRSGTGAIPYGPSYGASGGGRGGGSIPYGPSYGTFGRGSHGGPMHRSRVPRMLAGAPLLQVGSSADVRPYNSLTGNNVGTGPSAPNWGMGGSSGNADVDALDAQYQAVAQVIAANNPSADMQAAWARDYGQWQNWLADFKNAGTISQTFRTASLSAWQSIANDWGQAVKQQWPTATFPANMPTGQASPIGMYPTQPGPAPGGSVSIPGLPSWGDIGSTIGWIVIAVAVGLGIWILWPVAAHFGIV